MNRVYFYAFFFVLTALFTNCGSSSNDGPPTSGSEPVAVVTPSQLEFAEVEIGSAKTLAFTITNQGDSPLIVIDVRPDKNTSSEFENTIAVADLTINPGMTKEYTVTYRPTDDSRDVGSLLMYCDDGSLPCVAVGMAGIGYHSAPQPLGTYEGFGAVTQGAGSSPTGYDTFRVTSLADSGPGTLRDAVSQGRRHVVFDVGGTIVLQSDLNIPFAYVTIDGASAPSPGITIEQPGNIGTTIEARSSIGPAHDIIIHHLRMDGEAAGHTNDGDIWGLDGESAAVYNIILDHITAIASTDGVFDMWEEVYDVTLSWNLILDTVTACHFSTGDISRIRQRISIHHNVFARNNERQIRVRHNNQLIEFVNNVIYGWGWIESGSAGLHIAYDSGEINPSIYVVQNLYHHVPNLSGTPDRAVVFERGTSEGDVCFSGNRFPDGENDAVSTSGPPEISPAATVTRYPVDTLYNTVVPNAGTHYPTPEELQLLNEIQTAVR